MPYTRKDLEPFLHHIVRIDCQGPRGHSGHGRTSDFGVITDLGPGAGSFTSCICDDRTNQIGNDVFLYDQIVRVVDLGPYTPWKRGGNL